MYINHNYNNYYYSYINEQQKNNINEIDKISFKSERTKYLSYTYYNNYNNDYLIIKLYKYIPYKGAIYISDIRDSIYNEDTFFEYSKGRTAIIEKYAYY